MEAYLNETDDGLLERVNYEYMVFVSGMPSRWDESLKKEAGPATSPDPAPGADSQEVTAEPAAPTIVADAAPQQAPAAPAPPGAADLPPV